MDHEAGARDLVDAEDVRAAATVILGRPHVSTLTHPDEALAEALRQHRVGRHVQQQRGHDVTGEAPDMKSTTRCATARPALCVVAAHRMGVKPRSCITKSNAVSALVGQCRNSVVLATPDAAATPSYVTPR